MKLESHITIRLSGIFIITLFAWSLIYFYLQMTEIHDGIDEGLNNLKQEFVYKANRSPGFVTDMEKHNPLNIIIKKISYEQARDFKEIYSNTKVYFTTEEEEEEVRMLTTAFFCEQDNQYYQVKFFTSTVESEDLIKNMIYLLLALWICLAIAIAVVIKVVINKSNRPFYQLLDNLKGFRLDNTKMIELPDTNITEYTELNASVKSLLEENINAFTEQKNFIENASHEIQTPLTIVISKIELLMAKEDITKSQIEELNAILNSLNRMKRLNSSLLLLSKIRNKQFADSEHVNLRYIFEDVLSNFSDIIDHKNITVSIRKNNDTIAQMNKDLAYILANNLIKNAVSYNLKGGNIEIVFDTDSLTIANDGNNINLDLDIFERYVSATGNSKSTGLGLSIVKSIANIYNFHITYQYKEKKHHILLQFN
ncbi:HAMP domain-containing sensor histidine kinase [Prevotella sp. 10(H)]|uniref:sensor histidine kinase n=1 Tax=Prevotella sp. 10(H) TaxID=1158294 RepID=UPI0004A6E850|nr:HAMP domain-containing sensor histidine kinase [Prevotella sp. 10(H)]